MLALAAAAAMVATLAACSGTDSSAGGDGNLSISVVEPTSGAAVTVPFTVRLNSSVPLGPTESGKHHVHIWFDDNEAQYLIVESDTVQISNAPAGTHTMHVSLRNANHSPAGAEATTPVTIGDAPGDGTGGTTPASPAASSPASSPASDPYNY
jgi:hypothetical protein